MELPGINEVRIAAIGLGYVGLPLTLCMPRQFPDFGHDVDVERVAQVQAGKDRTREVSERELAAVTATSFSADRGPLKESSDTRL